jgi:hypothetical protein
MPTSSWERLSNMASLVPPNAYNALMGLFRPQAAPAGASAYDQAMAQARSNALGQFGMGLVAAAIPQTAAQRVQSLQAALGSFQPSTTDIYNQAQARLMLQRTEAEQAAQKRMEEELKTITGGTPPAAPASAPVGEFRELPEAAKKLLTAAPVPTAPTYTPQEAEYLKANSYSPEAFAQAKAKIAEAKLPATTEFAGSKTPLFVEYQGKQIPTYFNVNGEMTGPGGVKINTSDPSFRVLTAAEQAGAKAGAVTEAQAGAEAKVAAPQAIVTYDTAINAIDNILADPETLANVTGPYQGSLESPVAVYAGSGFDPKATGMVAKIAQLQSKAFISAIGAMKGFGSLSNAEGLKLDTAEARLLRAQDTGDFIAALNEYKDILGRAKQRQILISNGVPKEEAFKSIPESPFAGKESATSGNTSKPPSVPSGQSNVAKPASQAEYDALPSGTTFIDPEGTLRTKP